MMPPKAVRAESASFSVPLAAPPSSPRRSPILSDPSGLLEPEAGRSRRILIVEDDEPIRKALANLLDEEGYVATVAVDGEAALDLLAAEELPDLILLDLRMAGMNGWEFRIAQRQDSRLANIPVIAISADASAQAAAISADAFLSKPLETTGLLTTIERVLKQNREHRTWMRRSQSEQLTSLGRVSAGVGHRINTPLSFAMLNLCWARERLQRLDEKPSASTVPHSDHVNEGIHEVQNALAESLSCLERVHEAVRNLQMLSRELHGRCEAVQIEVVLDECIAMVMPHSQRCARITKEYGRVPAVSGSAGALAQVFLNLLMNAVEATAEGNPTNNEIAVFTSFDGTHVVVEIGDTGRGIAGDVLPQIFDPFFTTKRSSQGAGLGLAIANEIVVMHGGRLVIESERGRGTVCSVHLPPVALAELPPSRAGRTRLSRAADCVEVESSSATISTWPPRSLSQAVDAYEKELLVSVLRAMGDKRELTAKFLGISRKNLWQKLIKYGLQSRRASSDDPGAE